jgi:3-phenylpropionate/trans-cinnamate dioxygenase ferredoxin reductase subunit
MINSAIVIVGAGHSGSRAAYALRKSGFTGKIHLLGNEGTLPYDRPPLSKDMLLGKKTLNQCRLYEEQAGVSRRWSYD